MAVVADADDFCVIVVRWYGDIVDLDGGDGRLNPATTSTPLLFPVPVAIAAMTKMRTMKVDDSGIIIILAALVINVVECRLRA